MTWTTRMTRIGAVTVILLALSCVTVNVYFPAAEVEKAADRAVEQVYSEDEETSSSPTSWLNPIRRIFRPRAAYAQVNIDITTPAIRAMLASMEARHKKLVPFYESGAIGINKQGYLDIRSLDGLNLKEKADLNKLVQAENSERKSLYQEIAKANDLPPSDVPKVERIFAEKWREKAKAGWWIQTDDGAWKQKAG